MDSKMERCKCTICIVKDGVRGRMFTPPEGAKGVYKVWCGQCIRLSAEMNFYASQTAQMVRSIYATYVDTELPKEVKLILEQFTREVMQQLNEEL